jgi:hypothetical protein
MRSEHEVHKRFINSGKLSSVSMVQMGGPLHVDVFLGERLAI